MANKKYPNKYSKQLQELLTNREEFGDEYHSMIGDTTNILFDKNRPYPLFSTVYDALSIDDEKPSLDSKMNLCALLSILTDKELEETL